MPGWNAIRGEPARSGVTPGSRRRATVRSAIRRRLAGPAPPSGGAVSMRAGGETPTTNNRMELLAAIMALEALRQPCRVVLSTDSQYVQKGIAEWLPNWVRRGWKTAGGTPVKNQDLWQRLHAAAAPHRIEWKWVKGHAGHVENERVDRLARAEAERFRS